MTAAPTTWLVFTSLHISLGDFLFSWTFPSIVKLSWHWFSHMVHPLHLRNFWCQFLFQIRKFSNFAAHPYITLASKTLVNQSKISSHFLGKYGKMICVRRNSFYWHCCCCCWASCMWEKSRPWCTILCYFILCHVRLTKLGQLVVT